MFDEPNVFLDGKPIGRLVKLDVQQAQPLFADRFRRRSSPLLGAVISLALQLAGFMLLAVLVRPLLALVPVNRWTIEGALLLVILSALTLAPFAAHGRPR